VRAGATPVFVDIDEDTLNLDLDAVERAVTTRTRAVLPVHLYGQPVDMTRLVSIARRHGLRVIEDCAQAQGATWQGRQVGSFGDCGCLSFFPSKMVGAYGDGGMVLTDDATVAENVRVLRNHGAKRKYYHETNGFNSRLDALQAAVLDVKLKYLPQWIEARRRVATWYAEELEGMAGISTLPARPGAGHVYNYYTVRVAGGAARRDALAAHLKEQGIASAVYYPEPLHVQKVYDRLGYRLDDFPRAARASEQVLSLPIYPEMTRDQVKRVTAAIAQFT